jgi:hypothetical protein
MSPDRPTRRGFLAACSAAAAALGLAPKAGPTKQPIVLSTATPEWGTVSAVRVGMGGSGYTEVPTIVFSSGPGASCKATLTCR